MKRTRPPTTFVSGKRTKSTTKARPTLNAVRVPRGLGLKTGFPRQMKMTHKYCEPILLTYTAPSLSVVYGSWGVNCLFDPNLNVGGHQPYYFDQMTALYNHYICTGSRLVVEVVATTGVAYSFGAFIDDDLTPSNTSLTTVMENQTCNSVTKFGTNEPAIIRKKWDAKAAFGGNIMDNDNLQGDATANPTETQAYIVWLAHPTATVGCAVQGMLTIYYDVVWDELKQPTGS